MKLLSENNKINKIIVPFVAGMIFFAWTSLHTQADQQNSFNSGNAQKNITLDDDGNIFLLVSTAPTVGDFLNEQKIILKQNDVVLPDSNSKIFSGSKIIIERARKVIIKDTTSTATMNVFGGTVEQAVWASGKIELDEDDVTTPLRALPVTDGMTITVTHVVIKEETQNQDIPFNTVSNNDDTLSWRVSKTTQPGQKGVREVKYKVVYNNGKEISRKILESNIIKNPVDQIVTQGTYVKTGKGSTGAASWYAFRGGLFAANPWLPMGSYARVTNQDNGKSVIVKINDRGPFGNGRIIDLDKVAFAKIADLGAGVVNVKMEPVLN